MVNSFVYEYSKLRSSYEFTSLHPVPEDISQTPKAPPPYVSFLMSRQCDFEVEKQRQSRGKVEQLSASVLQRLPGNEQEGIERLKLKIKTTVEDSGMDTYNL